MASRSFCASQKDQILSMIQYFGTPSLLFMLSLAYVLLFGGEDINLDTPCDPNTPNKEEGSWGWNLHWKSK